MKFIFSSKWSLLAFWFLVHTVSVRGHKEFHDTYNNVAYQLNERQFGTAERLPISYRIGINPLQVELPIGDSAFELHKPLFGTIGLEGTNIIYTPFENAEGYERFTFTATSLTGESNHTVEIKISPSPSMPRVYLAGAVDPDEKDESDWELISDGSDISFHEESKTGRFHVIVLDPDTFDYSVMNNFDDQTARAPPITAPNEFNASIISSGFANDGSALFQLRHLDTIHLPDDSVPDKKLYGWAKRYELFWTGSGKPNYETLSTRSWPVSIDVKDAEGTSDHSHSFNSTISLIDINDPPKFLDSSDDSNEVIEVPEYNTGVPSTNSFALSLSEEDANRSFSWRIERKLISDDLDGDIIEFPDLSSIEIINEDSLISPHSVSLQSKEMDLTESIFEGNVTILFTHDKPNMFGKVQYVFTPFEEDSDDSILGESWSVTIDLNNDNSDPIDINVDGNSLPEGYTQDGSLIEKVHQEVSDGVFVWDFNILDPDIHPSIDLQPDNPKNREGAYIRYSLSGPDSEFFNEPDGNGIFTFKQIPDFEIKMDENGDNIYEVTVTVRDNPDGNLPSQQAFGVRVINLNEPPLLVSGDGNYSRVIRTREDQSWNSSLKKLVSGNTVTIAGEVFYALQAYDPDGQLPSELEPNQGTDEVEWIAPGEFGVNGSSAIYESDPLPQLIYTPGTDFAGEEVFELKINEKGTSPTDENSTSIVSFRAIVEPQSDPPFVESVSGLGLFFDGLGRTTFDIPIEEHLSGEIAVLLTFNEITDVNETFESVNLTDGFTNFELDVDPDNPDNPLVRKLTLLRDATELDYENPTMRKLTASLLVKERGENGSPTNKLIFNFNLTPLDEPPVLFEPVWGLGMESKKVREEQTFIATLQAVDPDDSNSTLTWVLSNTSENANYQFNNGSAEISSKNPVDLEFKSPPSYESGNDYNVTIFVYDTSDQTGQATELKFDFSLENINEPPKLRANEDGEIPSFIQLSIEEGKLSGDPIFWDFNQYFVDEDNDSITFSRVPISDDDHIKFRISSGILSFSELRFSDSELFPIDHSGHHYDFTVSARNPASLYDLEVPVKITLISVNEPPEVKRSTDGRLLSSFDPSLTEKIIIDIIEDSDEQTFDFSDLNLSLYDPERSSNIDISVVGYEHSTFNGDLLDGGYFFIEDDNLIDYENNSTSFKFKPPPNIFGSYYIDLNFSDGLEGSNSFLTLEFVIQDTQDPPDIEVVNPEFDAPSTSEFIYERKIKVPEGNIEVITLVADDQFDEPDATQSFYWEVNYGQGDDAELFKQFSTKSENTKILYWDETHPNLNYKPTNEDEDPSNATPASINGTHLEYKFSITVNEFQSESDESNSKTIQLHLLLVDADTPPAFIEPDVLQPNEFAFTYQELASTLTVGSVSAVDYDNEEKDDNQTTILYGKLQGYDGWLFDINETTGSLSFKESPDYEKPRDASTTPGDNTYEILLSATEYWIDGSDNLVQGPSTNQVFKVHVENTIEMPRFDSVLNSTGDANFSLDEHEDDPDVFEIKATTEDAYPVEGIEMLSGKDAHLFEVVSDTTESISFRFKRSPDFENPRDVGFNNLYDVDFKIITGSDSSDINETFLIKVNDLNSSLRFVNKDGSNNFEFNHYENQKLVTDLDVIDVEGDKYITKDYPDLFAVTEFGAFYALNTREENSTEAIYQGESPGEFNQITSESGWILLPEDFNNDGSIDVVLLKRDAIEVYLNDGLGTFEIFNESNFTNPDFAISGIRSGLAVDIDANGMVDLIVCSPGTNTIHIFQNKNGASAFREFGVGSSRLTELDHNISNPEYLTVSDIDGDADLDLVVTSSDTGEVHWLENLGSLKFAPGGIIAEPSKFLQALEADGLDISTIGNDFTGIGKVEAVDIDQVENLSDPFNCRDFIIPAKYGIYLAYNNGHGAFSLQLIARYGDGNAGFSDTGGAGVVAKGLDLRGESHDHFTDFVYLTSNANVPYFVLQREDGRFDSPRELFPELSNQSLALSVQLDKPNLLETYRSDSDQFVYISDSSDRYAFLFKSIYLDHDPWVKFVEDYPNWEPTIIDFGSRVRELGVADLDKKSNFIRFSISQEEDGSSFNDVIIASGGKLVFSENPDYENANGSGSSVHEYVVPVTASIEDNSGNLLSSTTEFVVVNLLDANDPPEFTDFVQQGSSIIPDQENYIQINHSANVLEIFESISYFNQESDTLLQERVTLSVSPNADGFLFEIDPDSGRFSFKDDYTILGQNDVPSSQKYGYVSFENLPQEGEIYEVWIRATDERGEFDQQKFIVNVTNGPDIPLVSVEDLNELSLQTNEDEDVSLMNLESLITSDSSLNFEIYTSLGLEMGNAEIRENSEFYYSPDGNKSGTDYALISVDDGLGALYCLALEILVNPVPDDPVSRVLNPVRLSENKKFVVELDAYDGDIDDLLRWTLDDPNDPLFKIVGESLYFKYAPDYENPYSLFPDNEYSANLMLWDSDNNDPVPVQIDILVTNLPDTKPSSILKSGPQNYLDVMEDENLVALLEVSDPDGMEAPVVQIVGGRDAARFTIASNDLRVSSSGVFDFENPVDHNSDNHYELEIRIEDDYLGDTYYVTVRVNDRDEIPPYFITGHGVTPYEIQVRENQKYVVQSIAKDSETTDLMFSVVGGSEEEFFKINAINGLLEFKEKQNFEYPSDADSDGTYEVIIQVSDGTHETQQTIIARLSDVNDIPYVLAADNTIPDYDPGTYSILEDISYSAQFNIVDEDGDSFVFEPYSGTSRGTFSINENSFTYLPEGNFSGTDSFEVKLSDDQGSRIQTLYLNVEPVNDLPVAEIDDFFYGDLSEDLPLFFDLLENDHAGPDDPAEEQFYQAQVISLPQFGTLKEDVNDPGRGRYFYTPNAGFIGEDIFEYSLIDGSDPISSSVGVVRIWIAKTESLPNLTALRNLGTYVESGTNWIYSLKLGWVYAQNVKDLYTSTWIWHDLLGWFWTGEKYFPWLYFDEHEKWLHWEGGVNEPKGWFTRDYSENIYDEDFFVRLKIRNEMIEILPDMAGLVDYLENSNYFSRANIVRIIGELNRFRKSNTLDSILDYKLPY